MSILLSSTLANESTPYYALASAPAPAPASPFAQGMIMMWDKTTSFPPGWFICDGAVHNGYTTPTLLDKFVISLGPSNPTPGLGGGAESVALTLDMIPNHTHVSIPAQAAGVAEGSGGGFAVDGTTDSGLITGYGTQLPVPTLPPYVSYAYICYCGIAP